MAVIASSVIDGFILFAVPLLTYIFSLLSDDDCELPKWEVDGSVDEEDKDRLSNEDVQVDISNVGGRLFCLVRDETIFKLYFFSYPALSVEFKWHF